MYTFCAYIACYDIIDIVSSAFIEHETVYSSPDGTGWYSMPEVGDTVRLYVPDKEGRCLVTSSVHKERLYSVL